MQALFELGARFLAILTYAMGTGKMYKHFHLNTKSLAGICDAHAALQRRLDTAAGSFVVEQFTEIFVFVLIFSQDLCMPVWNQYRVYVSEDVYSHRFATSLSIFAVQMGIEMFVDLFIWKSLRRFVSPSSIVGVFGRVGSRKAMTVVNEWHTLNDAQRHVDARVRDTWMHTYTFEQRQLDVHALKYARPRLLYVKKILMDGNIMRIGREHIPIYNSFGSSCECVFARVGVLLDRYLGWES